jgi:hypothetical protein
MSEDVPHTHTFRWKRWTFGSLAVLLLVIAGSLITITSAIDSRLQRIIRTYRDAGEPILMEDFGVAYLADASNAAVPLRRALDAVQLNVNKDDEKLINTEHALSFPLTDAEVQALRRLVEANRSVLNDAREARGRQGLQWGIPARTFLVPTSTVPEWNRVRSVAMALRYAAQLDHHDGNDADAVERMRDLITVGDSTHSIAPLLISHMIAIGISAMASDVVSDVATDLSIGQATEAAKRERVRALIEDLLDESDYRRGWRNAMNGERAMQLNQVNTTFAKPVIGTVYKLDAAKMLRMMTTYRDAGSAENAPKARDATAPLRASPPQLYTPLRSLLPSFENAITTHFRGLCERRMAAVALAIRMYRCDHGGRFPDRLEDLVPEYLPSLPKDPFAADGRSFDYDGAGPRPIIWSVGDNGADDNASTQPSSARHRQRGVARGHVLGRWETEDAIMHLTRQPRPEPPEDQR